jgi:hypothetical protein
MFETDIFEEYAKIAEETGLVKLAEDSRAIKKYKKDVAPRAGSDSITTIEALYGVKPDLSVKYENNIMEAAHPKSVVIAPSYDRLNGLVENEIERQKADINMVMKPVDGIKSMHRHATQELMLQLVRIANDMDNQDKAELVAIADNCIVELGSEKKKLNKIAILPWIIGGAVVLAGIWLWSHIDDPDKGLSANITNALKQLDDLKTNSFYESDVDETVQRDVAMLEGHLINLRGGVADFNKVMANIQKPRTLSEIKEVADMHGNDVANKMTAFVHAIDETLPLIVAGIKNFASGIYQKQHTKPSWMSEVSGYLGNALHGENGLFANDFISAKNALGTLLTSLKQTKETATHLDEIKAKYKADLDAGIGTSQQEAQKQSGFEDEDFEDEEYKHQEPNTNNLDFSKILNTIGYNPSDRDKEFFTAIK